MRPNDSAQRAGRLRTRAALFLLVALAAGGAAVMLVRQYLSAVQRTVADLEQPTRPVVVAAMDVPTGTTLEAKHLSVSEWPTASVPAGSFHKVEDMLGRTVRQDVFSGEVYMKKKLVDETDGQGLASLLVPGQRAMAVRVDPVVGVAGFVHPGDYVDVISTMEPDDETKQLRAEEAAWISRIVLQHVRVLAVGDKLSADARKSEPVTASVFTLAVTPEQSETLALAGQYGKLQLSLRSRSDTVAVNTVGRSPALLLAAGAEVAKAPAPAPSAPPVRVRVRSREQPVSAVAAAPTVPTAPVIEILRGTRVEERKLHTSPGVAAQ